MRIGELEKAENLLLDVVKNAKSNKFDWLAAACSNLVVVSIQLDRWGLGLGLERRLSTQV